jgi:hypothetical protein
MFILLLLLFLSYDMPTMTDGQTARYYELYIYIHTHTQGICIVYIYWITVCVKVQSTTTHIPKVHRIGQYLTYGLDVELDLKWQLGRPRRRRKYNIKMEVREVF